MLASNFIGHLYVRPEGISAYEGPGTLRFSVHRLCLYFVGVIAMLSLLRIVDGGADEDSVLEMLHRSWVGEVLLWIILSGMVSYMAWRFFEAVADPLQHGSDTKGILKRIGIAGAAAALAPLRGRGIQAMIGTGDSGEGFEEQRHLIAAILHWHHGPWFIGIAGVVVAFVAVMELRYVVARATTDQRWM